jgi:hypothetical protein
MPPFFIVNRPTAPGDWQTREAMLLNLERERRAAERGRRATKRAMKEEDRG